MNPRPPPDLPLIPPEKFSTAGVYLSVVGLTGERSAEIIAYMKDEDEVFWFRFNIKSNIRHIKRFFKSIGIRDLIRLEEGAYQHNSGYGPLIMKGTVVGVDEDESGKTVVLKDVSLMEQ